MSESDCGAVSGRFLCIPTMMMKMLGFASEKVFDYRYKVETVRSNRKLQSAAAAVLHYNQRWAVIFEIDML